MPPEASELPAPAHDDGQRCAADGRFGTGGCQATRSLPRSAARLACEAAKRIAWPWKATWPVGADLLFERVRSQRYMALTCVLNLYEWFHDYLTETRADLGDRKWGVYQLQPLFYLDCADSVQPEDLSGWLGLPCAGRPFGGPWWELLLWIFPLLLVNSGLNFVNNPFRSRWWSLAALAQIVMSLVRYVKLFAEHVSDLPDMQLSPTSAEGAYSVLSVLAVWREVIMVAGIVGPLLSWLLVLALLLRMLHYNTAFMEAWHEGAIRHTESLLSGRSGGGSRPGLPGRFQTLAEQLRGTCPAEDLPACALAALQEERRMGERRAAAAAAPKAEAAAGSARYWAGWLLGLLPRSPWSRRLPGETGDRDAAAAPAKKQPPSGGGSSPGKKTAEEAQHRLPGLVYVASLLSFVVVVLFSNVLFVGVLELHASCSAYTGQARAWADQAVQAADQVGAAAQQVQQILSFVGEQQGMLRQARQQLLDLQGALEPLPSRLRSLDPETAAAVERALSLARAAAELLPANVSLGSVSEALPDVPLEQWLARFARESDLLGGLIRLSGQSAEHVRKLRDWVHATSDVVMEVARSAGVASFLAGVLALVAVVALISWTCHQWRRIRRDVATGAVKGSVRWQPDVFHPVRAPMLPGLMASSALFAFFWLFVFVFFVIQVCWWLQLTLEWQTIKRLGLNTVLLLVFRVIVLDELVGRRALSHEGFVVRWIGFSWYICFALPFHLITSIAMAFSRFVMLVGVAIVYVVRLDTTLLPPGLQRYDPGYVSFMASVLLAHRHQNPVWQGFIHAFLHQGSSAVPREHSWTETLSTLSHSPSPHGGRHQLGTGVADEKMECQNRARCQWALLRTLVNNPQLALERRRSSVVEGQAFASAPSPPPPPASGCRLRAAGGHGLSPEDVKLSLSGDACLEHVDEEPWAAGSASSGPTTSARATGRRQQGRCFWMWSMFPGL